MASQLKLSAKKKNSIEEEKTELLKRISKENYELKKQKQCKICMDNDVMVLFLPCNHLVTCSTCACSVFQCVICRKNIVERRRIYI